MGQVDRSNTYSLPEIIGIAGNIGAGKSVVSRILRCNGFYVYDCDREASILMNNDDYLKLKLIEVLGDECYFRDGSLNRSYISSRIFSNESLRFEVNYFVHTSVKSDFISKASCLKGKVFVESAVMATSGLDRICDKIWVIDASEEVRLKRVMLRSGLKEKDIRKRMKAQQWELSKLPLDKVIVIDNDDSSNVLEKVLVLAFNDVKSLSLEYSYEN